MKTLSDDAHLLLVYIKSVLKAVAPGDCEVAVLQPPILQNLFDQNHTLAKIQLIFCEIFLRFHSKCCQFQ